MKDNQIELNESTFKSIQVDGARLPSTNFFEILTAQKFAIVHFLRHLDCIYCQASVDDIYRFVQANPGFPIVYFVHHSDIETGESFFAQHFPNVSHISDKNFVLYRLFGIKRIKYRDFLNLRTIYLGFKRTFQGYVNRNVFKDDNLILSGTFLFRSGELIWSYRAKFAGDDIKWDKIGKK